MTDYISRADAVKTVIRKCSPICDWQDGTQQYPDCVVAEINALPSAVAESDDLIIKGAKGIQDGLYNIKDGKLFKYKGKGGTVRTYPIVPSADAEQGYTEWLEKIIVDNEGANEWLCDDTPDMEWCEKNCHYSSIQVECLRHLYAISKGGDTE